MAKPVRSPSLFFHAIAAGSAALALFLLPLLGRESLQSDVNRVAHEEFAVEHQGPLSLTFALAMGADRISGIAELAHDGTETVMISLPESWKLYEVRGRALAEVPSDDPSFGFVRWHVPSKTTVSFRVQRVPRTLNVHNPSGAPLQIRLTTVDLESGSVNRNIILVKNARATLW